MAGAVCVRDGGIGWSLVLRRVNWAGGFLMMDLD
jgi:hypothetical protein